MLYLFILREANIINRQEHFFGILLNLNNINSRLYTAVCCKIKRCNYTIKNTKKTVRTNKAFVNNIFVFSDNKA